MATLDDIKTQLLQKINNLGDNRYGSSTKAQLYGINYYTDIHNLEASIGAATTKAQIKNALDKFSNGGERRQAVAQKFINNRQADIDSVQGWLNEQSISPTASPTNSDGQSGAGVTAGAGAAQNDATTQISDSERAAILARSQEKLAAQARNNALDNANEWFKSNPSHTLSEMQYKNLLKSKSAEEVTSNLKFWIVDQTAENSIIDAVENGFDANRHILAGAPNDVPQPPKRVIVPPADQSTNPPGAGEASRGQFAQSLYNALGIDQQTSSGKFSDAGGVASTLKDLGITNGVGDGSKFGSNDVITRGQAFTMMARGLGLVDNSADIQTASNALRDAGIVKGYNNTGELGLNDPLQDKHVSLLMDRMAPHMNAVDTESGLTRSQAIDRQVGVLAAGDATTRGEFAKRLYSALGIDQNTSTGAFKDTPGDLGKITSTLKDLGITNGIGGGNYGSNATITRGQAFTMIARSMGLVEPSASIEEGTAALRKAGVINGYADGTLGTNDSLREKDLNSLIARLPEQMSKTDSNGINRYDRIDNIVNGIVNPVQTPDKNPTIPAAPIAAPAAPAVSTAATTSAAPTPTPRSGDQSSSEEQTTAGVFGVAPVATTSTQDITDTPLPAVANSDAVASQTRVDGALDYAADLDLNGTTTEVASVSPSSDSRSADQDSSENSVFGSTSEPSTNTFGSEATHTPTATAGGTVDATTVASNSVDDAVSHVTGALFNAENSVADDEQSVNSSSTEVAHATSVNQDSSENSVFGSTSEPSTNTFGSEATHTPTATAGGTVDATTVGFVADANAEVEQHLGEDLQAQTISKASDTSEVGLALNNLSVAAGNTASALASFNNDQSGIEREEDKFAPATPSNTAGSDSADYSTEGGFGANSGRGSTFIASSGGGLGNMSLTGGVHSGGSLGLNSNAPDSGRFGQNA